MESEDQTPESVPPLLPTRDGYVPIAERLNQDVWHDNFVPKYSAIGSAEPSRVVLLGVWMIFGPIMLSSFFAVFFFVGSARDIGSLLGALSWSALYGILPGTLLWKQTSRYMHHRRSRSLADADD